MSYKSVPQECPNQTCPTRVSHVPQEFPTRLSHKSVPQECPTRVSYKSVPQECPTRVPFRSILQECPVRVSHKSVLQECHLDICSFSNVFAFGFVGSILFFNAYFTSSEFSYQVIDHSIIRVCPLILPGPPCQIRHAMRSMLRSFWTCWSHTIRRTAPLGMRKVPVDRAPW